MVIEFTGCTSAGKSWVVSKTKNCLTGDGISYVSGYDFVLSHFRLNPNLFSSRLKSLFIDVLLFPWSFVAAIKNFRYCSVALLHLFCVPMTCFMRVNIMRNLVKVIALQTFLSKRCPKKTFCILDEGPIHSLHNVFAHYSTNLNPKIVRQCLETIPLSDIVVVVSAPPDVIAERALARCDAPWRQLSRQQWLSMGRQAEQLFDIILGAGSVRRRVKCIANDGDSFETNKAIHELCGQLVCFK